MPTTRFDRRAHRAPRHPSVLTVRDQRVLQLAARVGALHTGHVQALLGVTATTARRVLTRLKDAGTLRCIVPAANAPNWFVVSMPRAGEVLAEAFGEDPATVRVLRDLPGQLDHHAALVSTYLALEVGAAHLKTRLHLQEVLFDWEIRSLGGGNSRDAHYPDLVVVLDGARGQRVSYAIEVDRGTIAPNVMAQRAREYAEAWRSGERLRSWPWRVLTVCVGPHGARRRNRLALRFLEEELPEGLCYFTGGDLDPRSAYTDGAWWTVRTDPNGTPRLVRESPFSTLVACADTCADGGAEAPVDSPRHALVVEDDENGTSSRSPEDTDPRGLASFGLGGGHP